MSRSCAQPTRSLRKIALYSPVRRSYLLLDKSKRFNSDSWRLQKSSGFAVTVAPRTGKGGGDPRSPRGTALGLSWTRPGTPHVRSGLFWIPSESSQLTLFHRALLWTKSWHSCLEEFVDGLNCFEPALWITKLGSVLLFLQVYTLWKVIFQTITQFLQVLSTTQLICCSNLSSNGNCTLPKNEWFIYNAQTVEGPPLMAGYSYSIPSFVKAIGLMLANLNKQFLAIRCPFSFT